MTALPPVVEYFKRGGEAAQIVDAARAAVEALPFDAQPVPTLTIEQSMRFGKFTLTPRGVSGIDADVDSNDVVSALKALDGLKDSVNWWTADLLVLGEMNGEQLAEVLGVDEVSGYALLNRQRVARKYALKERCPRQQATFWMHSEVAHLPHDVRWEMLMSADSVSEIREMKRAWMQANGYEVDDGKRATVSSKDIQGSAQRTYLALGEDATRQLIHELERLLPQMEAAA